MRNLREFVESKQIHFIYKIIQSEYENWNTTGKHWLKSLDTEYNTDYFICKCTSIKGLDLHGLSKYNQDCISSWVKFHGVVMQKNRQSILESCLFGNKYIIYRNSPIFISSFCKGNIKTVRDIWNIQTNSFHAPELVRDRLLDHIGWNARYNKIKKQQKKQTKKKQLFSWYYWNIERSLCTASNSKRYYYQYRTKSFSWRKTYRTSKV